MPKYYVQQFHDDDDDFENDVIQLSDYSNNNSHSTPVKHIRTVRPKEIPTRREIILEPSRVKEYASYHDQYYESAEGVKKKSPKKKKKGHTIHKRVHPQVRTAWDDNDFEELKQKSEIRPFTKFFLFAVNFIAFVVGLGIVAMSSYVILLKEKTLRDALDFFLDPACMTCLVGSVVTALSFLGFYGSLRENSTMLKIYNHCMDVLVVLEVLSFVFLIVSFNLPDLEEKVFPTGVYNNVLVLKYRSDLDVQNLIDTIQTELKCCGISNSNEGFLEWNQNPYFKCNSSNQSPERCSVPHSCCILEQGKTINYQCGGNVMTWTKDGTVIPGSDTWNIYTHGCLKSVKDGIANNIKIIGSVSAGVILPQIVLVVFTWRLRNMIQNQKDRWTEDEQD